MKDCNNKMFYVVKIIRAGERGEGGGKREEGGGEG